MPIPAGRHARQDQLAGASADRAYFTVAGGLLYFRADGGEGMELWRSDGTAAGTFVIDIKAGPDGSYPLELAAAGGRLFFTADDNVVGYEVWTSDGTVAGTTVLADLNTSIGSSPARLAALGDKLLFAANDYVHGTELWTSDGTGAGTTLVKDIRRGSLASGVFEPVEFGGAIYFRADGADGFELWKTDGTTAGTVQVKDIYEGALGSGPSQFVEVGGRLYFVAQPRSGGYELWRTDGTGAGTTAVTALPGPGQPQELTAVGTTLFFSYNDGTHAQELWKYDTLTGVAELVRDIRIGGPAFINDLAAIGDTLFFRADDGNSGSELWKSDGTAVGTVRVKDINAGSAGSFAHELTVVGDRLFFVADNGIGGRELWTSDGTDAGTRRVKDIHPGSAGSSVHGLTVVGDQLFFVADNGTDGYELWTSDGTEAGTQMVRAIVPAEFDHFSAVSNLTAIGDVLYFSANDGTHGTELWQSDGTAAGTFLVYDVHPGRGDANPAWVTAAGGAVYFRADDGTHGEELWKLPAGTIARPTMPQVATDTATPGDGITSDNTLVFTGRSEPGSTVEVYLSGALVGTVTTDAAGRWLLDHTGTALPGGQYVVHAVAEDLAGNRSSGSIELSLTVDTAPPAIPVVTRISEDTGASGSDGVTSDTRPTFFGTVAPEAGLRVELFIDGLGIGTAAVDAAGDWSVDYTGLPLTEGAHAVTAVTVDPAGWRSAPSDPFTVTIGEGTAPVARPDSYPVNEDGSVSVPAATGVLANDIDPNGDPLTATLASGPDHGTLTLNPDGSFGYTPAANYSGSDTFTYRASDGTEQSGLATVTLSVIAVNDAPTASDEEYAVAEDGTLSVPAGSGVLANDQDVDGDALSTLLVSGPSSGTLTLNPDGSFSYTPHTNFHGLDSFTYKANDGRADSGVATVTIWVTPVNDVPVAIADLYSPTEDLAFSVAAAEGVLANDSDVDSTGLTALLVAGPSSGTLSLNPDGSFTYTPNANFHGLDSFSYRASDGTTASGVVNVTLRVKPVNDAPLGVGDEYTTAEDGVLTVAAAEGVLSNDTDVDGDPLTVATVSGPSFGTLSVNPDGSFTYTPNTNYSGTDSFIYRATDGSSVSDPVTVSLTISPVNDAPVARPDGYTIVEDGTLTVTVPGLLANDTDIEGDALAAALDAGPSHGTLTLNADGSFTYQPTANFHGTDSFTYRASDGSLGSEPITVQLTITPVNDAPSASPDAYEVDQDTPLTVAAAEGVLANDQDPDGDGLIALIGAEPMNGTLTLNPDGSLSYTPAAGFSGTDSFTYVASDSQDESAPAIVTITVHPATVHPAPQLTIDILPGDPTNTLDLKRDSTVGVLIYSVAGQQVVVDSLTFGARGDEDSLDRHRKKGPRYETVGDLNGDGTEELIVYFRTSATNLSIGDTQATLKGQLSDGTSIAASGPVQVVDGRGGRGNDNGNGNKGNGTKGSGAKATKSFAAAGLDRSHGARGCFTEGTDTAVPRNQLDAVFAQLPGVDWDELVNGRRKRKS